MSISGAPRPFPKSGPLKDIGQVSSYIATLGEWMREQVTSLNVQAKTIPYALVADLPPLAGPPRIINVPDDPTYGQVLCFNGVTGTETGWYRLIPAGTAGAPSATIPGGGLTGQVLGKNSTADFDFAWLTPRYVSTGGTSGQALRKTGTATDSYAWADVHEVPAGGTTSQVLAKTGTADYATAWATIYQLPTGGTTGQLLQKAGTADGTATWSDALGTKTSPHFTASGPLIVTGTLTSSTPPVLVGQTTSTTVGAAGTASALPANPTGYLTLSINGAAVKLPYYGT